MTTEILPGLMAIDVPEGATGFEVVYATSAGTYAGTMLKWKEHPSSSYKSLPDGTWLLIHPYTCDKYTEEDAKGVVESKMIKKAWDDRLSQVWMNYKINPMDWNDKYLDTAKESLQSLLSKYNLDEKKTILLKLLK